MIFYEVPIPNPYSFGDCMTKHSSAALASIQGEGEALKENLGRGVLLTPSNPDHV